MFLGSRLHPVASDVIRVKCKCLSCHGAEEENAKEDTKQEAKTKETKR